MVRLIIAGFALSVLAVLLNGCGDSGDDKQFRKLGQLNTSPTVLPVLTALANGSIAVATPTSVELFNSSAVHGGGSAYAHLPYDFGQGPGNYGGIVLALPDGGIVAACGGMQCSEYGETIHFFNASAVQSGGPAYSRRKASGHVLALSLTPDGGIAAGSDSSHIDFFNSSGTVPYVHSASCSECTQFDQLVRLPNGCLAAGGRGNPEIQIFNTSAFAFNPDIQSGGPAFPSLVVPTTFNVCALASLSDGGIAVGDFDEGVFLFNASGAQQGSPYARLPKMGKKGDNVALLALPNGGLLVGSGAQVDMYSASAIAKGGAADVTLQVSGQVFAGRGLALLTDGVLAVARTQGTVPLPGEWSWQVDLFALPTYAASSESRVVI